MKQVELRSDKEAKTSQRYLKWAASLSGAVSKLEYILIYPYWNRKYKENVSKTQTGLSKAEFETAFAQGQVMTWEEGVEFAFSLRQLYYQTANDATPNNQA
jgi:hypothetical protein